MDRDTYMILWDQLAEELNEMGPPTRTSCEWRRVWSVFKYNRKRKRTVEVNDGGSYSRREERQGNKKILMLLICLFDCYLIFRTIARNRCSTFKSNFRSRCNNGTWCYIRETRYDGAKSNCNYK